MESVLTFNSIDLAWLDAASDQDLDELNFGVIGMDEQGVVTRYNQFESRLSRLSAQQVIGRQLFQAVAPCMNNPLIAGHIRAAQKQQVPLDEIVPYVLAFKFAPVAVDLRLLYSPASTHHYLLIAVKD